LGKIEKLHIIKNSIGIKTGRVIAVYSTMESLVGAINNFKDKMPFFKPVKIRFFREFKIKKALPIKNNTELVRDLIESFKDGRRKKTTLPETPPPV